MPLTPDASTRNYFRIPWKKGKAVAAVYPEPFDPEFHPYLDVTRLFLENDIPVPEIYAVDGQSGIIVQEDLGDRQLFRVYEAAPEGGMRRVQGASGQPNCANTEGHGDRLRATVNRQPARF